MYVFTFLFSSSSIEQLGTADSIAKLFEGFGECVFLVRLLQGTEVEPHVCKVQYYSLANIWHWLHNRLLTITVNF